MTQFLFGAVAMANAVAALVFLRYFQRTRDRFFLFFATSFALQSLGSVLATAFQAFDDTSTNGFVLRLFAYLLILAGVFDKNLPRRRKS